MKQLLFIATISLVALSCQRAGLAADWGYDGVEPATPVQPQAHEASAAGMSKSLPLPTKAVKVSPITPGNVPKKNNGPPAGKPFGNRSLPMQPAPASVAKPVVPETKSIAKPAINSTESYVDKNKQAAICWLQLCQGSSKEQLTYSQQKSIESYMLGKAKLGGKNTEEVLSILKFWPKFIFQLRDKPELEFQYADLFRALLRIRKGQECEKITVDGSEIGSDSQLFTDLLGLERIAVPGEPPMTESAVNAYSDMACFIYEQQHDGKTIDANDNRTLFARVITDKFREAPTAADRRAMANFDLSWAKFKIIWFNSNEKTRHVLLEKLIKTGAGSTMTVAKDPVMESILSNWPWPL